MKFLRTLTRQPDQRQQKTASNGLKPPISSHPLNRVAQQVTTQAKQWGQRVQTLQPHQLLEIALRPNTVRRRSQYADRVQPPLVFIVAVVSLSSAIGYRLYNEPQLGVGAVAPQTLRAPESARVVDTKTTELNRKAARTASVPILMLDQASTQETYQALQRLLDRAESIRQQAGAFPFTDPTTLSTRTQLYLRQAEEWQWRSIVASVEGITANSSNSGVLPSPPPPSPAIDSSQQLATLELQAYRRAYPAEDFSALKDVIDRARQRYTTALGTLAGTAGQQEERFYTPALLELTDLEWERTQTAMRAVLQRVLTQGIPPGLPDSLLKTAIQAQLEPAVPIAAFDLATEALVSVVQPNLVQDPEQTKLRAEQAAQAVDDVVVEIAEGEVIVRNGELIDQADFVLLDYFGLSRRRINWGGLLGFSALVSGSVAVFLLVERRFHPGLRRRDHLLLVLLTLSTPLIVALNLPAVGLPAVGLLVGSFYGSALGVTVIGLLSLVLPIGMEIAWINLVASALGGLLGAAMAGRLRSREELAMLGGAVGLTQGVVYLLLSLMTSTATTPVWYIVLTTAALQGLIGIAWSVFALGISPYLENLFDLITPIRLAELSNPNRPLLKRLASETPGTFQHTLFVATLAEAAAHALGCNVELVRAGTLYHDIGKMHDPRGFVENQMGGPNKHDDIDNPWVSAAIIKKHVTEGLNMARKCRLPRAIQAFIPEHQGTMLIAYFYHQALQRAESNPDLQINEKDFRYDGPIPQTRETGIVMLADSCEAALRSLKDATPDEAFAMVNRILRARWQDNQLVDSGLTRADMTRIAEIFVEVWLQFNHQRIPYPKAALSPQPSGARD